MTFVFIIAGLVLLVAGGDILVRGAVTLATRLGISPLLVGLTVVGFGTSTPELVTSLDAAFSGAPGISIGNVVGSNIANILLILGVAALIMPVAVSPKAFWRDAAALSLATLAGAALVLHGELTRIAGAFLLGGLVAYIVVAFRSESRGPVVDAAPEPVPAGGIARPALLALAGIATTIVGARLLVSGAVDLAAGLGVSDALIGLTIVAVGTSLPELVTAVIAAVRRQGDIAFGNVVGSNIYNILGILGVTALVHPITVPTEIAAFDIGTMLAATLALVVLAFTGWQVSRREGAALLIAYVGYVGWLVANA
ncbi:calcium/sodium antiporter [Maritimibacter sp. HL-12]|jgi:cation:H+ antiporter|uniref:calcium/sodium antiporter n=1 Tax=Maritimibacter sp. HL-12 TaxID=1162418 RepID=UPI000A0F28CF|nr:calcium/sodium antiporter [Maritimibacter sp. HL-12]SMH52154.1 cation:H+ antiporter [Maritimibacter sp. HL-12]